MTDTKEHLINKDIMMREMTLLAEHFKGKHLSVGEQILICDSYAEMLKSRSGFEANVMTEAISRGLGLK